MKSRMLFNPRTILLCILGALASQAFAQSTPDASSGRNALQQGSQTQPPAQNPPPRLFPGADESAPSVFSNRPQGAPGTNQGRTERGAATIGGSPETPATFQEVKEPRNEFQDFILQSTG